MGKWRYIFFHTWPGGCWLGFQGDNRTAGLCRGGMSSVLERPSVKCWGLSMCLYNAHFLPEFVREKYGCALDYTGVVLIPYLCKHF